MTFKLYITAGANGGIWTGKPNTETASGTLIKETSGTTESLYQMACNLTTNSDIYKIIVVGNGGGIFLSNRVGLTSGSWSKVHQDSAPLYGCAYGNGVWIAVGDYNKILSSTNGSTWTTRTGPIADANWFRVCYGAGQFIAVGSNTANNKGYIMSSPDGVTWTRLESGVNQALQSIAYSPELNTFAVVGNNGTILTGSF